MFFVGPMVKLKRLASRWPTDHQYRLTAQLFFSPLTNPTLFGWCEVVFADVVFFGRRQELLVNIVDGQTRDVLAFFGQDKWLHIPHFKLGGAMFLHIPCDKNQTLACDVQ